MAYTSAEFWLFLAAVLGGAALLPAGARAYWLIAASLWFFAADDLFRLIWLGGVMALTLGLPRLGPWGGRSAVVALVALLVWAKYADAFGWPDPGAPPGFSFLIFTAIALVVETGRRGQAWPLAQGVLHLVWFPKMLAGPIERPGALIPQMAGFAPDPALWRLGFGLLLSGLIKKLVIADSLAGLVDRAFAIPQFASVMDLLFAVYFFAFQIYCDFSGYADIALGLSAMVGLRLARNFDRPYLAVTVSEFWASRWHITLGHWFRDFVYFPLGGSKYGPWRRVGALMAVFLLSGLWHAGLGYGLGWGFVVWGALNGALVSAEAFVAVPKARLARLMRGIVTFHLILLTWVFFRAATLGDALTILRRIGAGLPDLVHLAGSYPLTADHWLGIGMILVLLGAEALCGRQGIAAQLAVRALPVRWAAAYAVLVALVLLGHWQGATFIYAGF